MPKIFLVAGLGFGDEGKGAVTSYLTATHRAHTVVRYNGGAQAAHNVVLSDGTHHTFSQFGSGTFHGAATHLSRFMLIDPLALLTEGTDLRQKGAFRVFENLTIERGAPLITPYQKGANRLREILRNQNRHGSCGMGIGETVSDKLTHGKAVPIADDLLSRPALEEKLSFIRKLKLSEFAGINLSPNPDTLTYAAFKMLTLPVRKVADLWLDAAKSFRIVSDNYLRDILNKPGPVIFEGAQGVLLDQNWGFHPYTTWTDITFANAFELLFDTSYKYNSDIQKIGVIRTYLTRHGRGPFPTQIREVPASRENKLEEKHNALHDWQGNFRVGYFDMVLFQYALQVIEQVDCVALTHLDALQHLDKMCCSYDPTSATIHRFLKESKLVQSEGMNLEYQESLGKALSHSGLRLNYWPINDDFVEILQDMAKVKVGITSRGPRLEDMSSIY